MKDIQKELLVCRKVSPSLGMAVQLFARLPKMTPCLLLLFLLIELILLLGGVAPSIQ
eukprot:c31424_g1_i1 orf=89-259(+)